MRIDVPPSAGMWTAPWRAIRLLCPPGAGSPTEGRKASRFAPSASPPPLWGPCRASRPVSAPHVPGYLRCSICTPGMPYFPPMSFADRLRTARLHKGWSQAQLAATEEGPALAGALGLSVDELVLGQPPRSAGDTRSGEPAGRHRKPRHSGGVSGRGPVLGRRSVSCQCTRRRLKPRLARPRESKASVAGSGTGASPGRYWFIRKLFSPDTCQFGSSLTGMVPSGSTLVTW